MLCWDWLHELLPEAHQVDLSVQRTMDKNELVGERWDGDTGFVISSREVGFATMGHS